MWFHSTDWESLSTWTCWISIPVCRGGMARVVWALVKSFAPDMQVCLAGFIISSFSMLSCYRSTQDKVCLADRAGVNSLTPNWT